MHARLIVRTCASVHTHCHTHVVTHTHTHTHTRCRTQSHTHSRAHLGTSQVLHSCRSMACNMRACVQLRISTPAVSGAVSPPEP